MHVFVDNLHLRTPGQLCALAESTWPAVGRIDNHGQQNALFVTLVGRTKGILKPVFTDFDGFICLQVAQMPRSRDVAIFMVMITDDRQTKPIALPLAHARGITTLSKMLWVVWL